MNKFHCFTSQTINFLTLDSCLFCPGGITLLFISSAITMAIPFALGKVIDIIYGANQESMVENLTNISLVLVGVFIFGAASNFGRTYLMGISGMFSAEFFSSF